MSFSATISRKTVVLALLLIAAALSVAGNWVSGDLRSLAQMVMLPLWQPGTSVALTIRGRVGEFDRPSGRWQRKLDELNAKLKEKQDELDRAHTRFAEHLRMEEDQKHLHYGLLKEFPCELVAARVVAGQSLPYGQTRVLRASGARPGAYVTTVDLLTDRVKTLPEEDLLAMDAMDSKALVGRVVSSGMATAQLQLVTDGDFQLSALIWRDLNNPRDIDTAQRRERLTAANNMCIPTTIRGDGAGGMVATDVFKSQNVLPGDWIDTDGRSKAMPDRIRIGRVVGVKPDPRNAGLVTLLIAPMTDFASLRDVYIVIPLSEPAAGGKN